MNSNDKELLSVIKAQYVASMNRPDSVESRSQDNGGVTPRDLYILVTAEDLGRSFQVSIEFTDQSSGDSSIFNLDLRRFRLLFEQLKDIDDSRYTSVNRQGDDDIMF